MKLLSPLIAALCLCTATTNALGATLDGGPESGPTAFDDMPAEAMQAFRRYYFDDMGGAAGCRGMTAEAAILAIGPLFRTDYNADGVPDFIFQSPCEPPPASPAATPENGRLLVSDPFGYHVAHNFAASVGRLNGEVVVLAIGECPQAQAPSQEYVESGVCYVGRRWNAARNRWGAVEDLSRLALAPGPSAPARPVAVAPLEAPVAATVAATPSSAKPPVAQAAKPAPAKPAPAKPVAAKAAPPPPKPPVPAVTKP
jgi:hypothetical protein